MSQSSCFLERLIKRPVGEQMTAAIEAAVAVRLLAAIARKNGQAVEVEVAVPLEGKFDS